MSRKTYIILIALLFGITYVPDLLSTLLKQRILIDYIPRPTLKLILFFLVGFMESTLMKTDKGGVMGWLLMIGFIVGYLWRIMHWPDGKLILWCTTTALLSLWMFFAYKERNKDVLNFMLWGFVVVCVGMFTIGHHEWLWWSDLLLGSAIAIVAGIATWKSFNYRIHSS